MKRSLFLIAFVVITFNSFAQQIDTIYYDKDGYGVSHKEFADYYRVVLLSTDSVETQTKYRDFHINGELMSSGTVLSIDENDDRNTKFVGTIIIHDKDGRVSAIRNYQDGLLHGISEEYFIDGTIIQEEFEAGKLSKDYYVKSDWDGNIVKIRYSDNSIIWDSPDPSEMTEEYHDGNKWWYYSKNGVTIALHTVKIRDYGKYHALNITISNNSLVPIEFEPSANITAKSYNIKKDEETPLKVYSCEDYLKKIDKRHTWAAVMMGISDVISIADATVIKHRSVSVNSSGEATVSRTKTYDPLGGYLALDMAVMRSRDFEEDALDGREIHRVGYFKRSTINPGEAVTGYAYVQRIKGDEIIVNIDIEGAIFTFTWNIRK